MRSEHFNTNALFEHSAFLSGVSLGDLEMPHFRSENTIAATQNTDINCPTANRDLFFRYLNNFVQSKYLPEPTP